MSKTTKFRQTCNHFPCNYLIDTHVNAEERFNRNYTACTMCEHLVACADRARERIKEKDAENGITGPVGMDEIIEAIHTCERFTEFLMNCPARCKDYCGSDYCPSEGSCERCAVHARYGVSV